MASKGPKTGAAKPVATTTTAQPKKAAPKPATAAEPVAKKAVAPVVEAPKPAPAADLPTPAAKPAPAPVEAVAAPTPVVAPVPAPVVEPVAAAPVEVKPVVTKTKAVPAPRTATPAKKEASIMETTIENTVNRAQAVIADLNDRAKTTIERNVKLVEEFNDFGKGNIEAVVESSRIAAKHFEAMGQDAAEYSRKSFEHATAALKGLSQIKSPADFFKLQNDFVRQSFDAMVAETSKNTEAMMKLANDVSQPISNRFAVAAEKVKSVAA